MPRAPRVNIGRRTNIANNSYNYRQRVSQRNNNQLNMFYLKSAFDYRPDLDYVNSSEIEIGSMNVVCVYCLAKKWNGETPGLCCSGGKVSIDPIKEPPELILSLLTDTHPHSKHFLDNVRRYNNLFQMTSFGAKEIRENYMPTFKIQGQVYHLIGSLLPEPNHTPKYLQIYFMSDSDQIASRSNSNPNLIRGLIGSLQNVLQEFNPLIRSFKFNYENRTTEQLQNLKLIIHAEKIPVGEHRGRYNAPTVNEVAVLLIDEDKGPRDIVLQGRDGQLKRVSELHRSYDSLQYPLIFISGEDGYHIDIKQHNSNRKVTCMQFYAYRFMIRENFLNHLHLYRNLFNQYVVDVMAKMISERLNFLRFNQPLLRSENYVHLRDATNNDANIEPANIGQKVILPSTFTGSPRYMHEKTQDALTYVRKKGRPDLFVTFTCNPDWPEIKKELFKDQKPSDRHDIISRVFHLKLKKLMHLITKKCIFGEVECFIYSVEWQKRGLPHCHILLWLQTKIRPDDIDKIISAELPDKDQDPLLYDIVSKNMIHGPCGQHNMTSPCMNNGICTKKYPRKFVKETQTSDDGYPTYRRRSPEDGGFTTIIKVRGVEIEVDNRWVVPYCPVLSRSLNAHINVEYCHSVQAIKYICKYVNKGSDRATASVENDNDEISNYLNGRYICTSEAFWRFFNFSIHERFPTVVHLDVHLENNQRVYFTEQNFQQVIENPRKTTLTAFFELCSSDDFAKTLLYSEVPAYFTWSNNQFSRRKRGQDVAGYPGVKKDTALGRIYTVHPNQSECFHLRMLLNFVRGPTSFQQLKTVEGTIYPTFKAACQAFGLLESDDQWKNTLSDATISENPSKLRDLFAIILVFCEPSQPQVLWDLFKKHFCEDILHRVRTIRNDFNLEYSEEIFNRGLIEIEDKVVRLSEKYLTDFGMNSPIRDNNFNINPLEYSIQSLHNNDQLQTFVQLNLPKLVADQRQAFDRISDSIHYNRGTVFFLDAPGGTGKTFLINLLLAQARSNGNVSLAVASSGIAATLLSGGRTAHSTFKLPLSVFSGAEFICPIRKNGPLGIILQETKFIVWDECTMTHRAHVEAIDRTLRDLRSNQKLMGGITFVFAGDFRQTLPVIPRGTRADIINACLKSSNIWHHVETINLRTNMRAHLGGGNSEFPDQLLKIGNGTIENNNGYININPTIGTLVNTVEELISHVYPDIFNLPLKPYQWLCERAIISPRNITAEEINNVILQKFEGQSRKYLSIDTVLMTDDVVHYPPEFLNSLTPSGFPPHELSLKIGSPVILLRNLQPPNLCNGTRLQITNLRDNIIEAVILTGPASGEIAYIPRIPMIPTDLPFQFKRLQFPVKVSFAMTINKSQGQTYNYVGIDLRSECFSHGQLYVGLSRTGNPDHQFILIPAGSQTKNIIYPEVL